MVLLSGDVSAAHILMGTPVLPFTSWYSVACLVIYSRLLLLMNIGCFLLWTIFLNQVLALVKIILCPHAALSGSHTRTSSSLGTSCGSPSIWSVGITEIIEVVEH